MDEVMTEVTQEALDTELTETYYSLDNTFYGPDLGGSE